MTTITKTTLPRFISTAFSRPSSVIARLLALQSVYKERRALAEMDNDRLSDIGVTVRQAMTEAKRPAWDAPQRWLR